MKIYGMATFSTFGFSLSGHMESGCERPGGAREGEGEFARKLTAKALHRLHNFSVYIKYTSSRVPQ